MDLYAELSQIPGALRDLITYYERGDGRSALQHLPTPTHPLLVGMGASYHAAWIGALMLRRAGIACHYEEASDTLYFQAHLLQKYAPLVYLSQSGASGEITPLLAQFGDHAQLIGISNKPDSPLGRAAGTLLPLMGGEESWIAGKTYVNALGVLWLMTHAWSGAPLPAALDALRATADQAEHIRQTRQTDIDLLTQAVDAARRVVFLGHGPHAATAREAAMTLSEWPKLACSAYGVGAYRHGFIETTDADTTLIFFTPPGPTRASTLALAEEVQHCGARVLRIENGRVLEIDEAADPVLASDEFLSPILDMLPIQWFAEAAARQRFATPGFRYLTKIVSNI